MGQSQMPGGRTLARVAACMLAYLRCGEGCTPSANTKKSVELTSQMDKTFQNYSTCDIADALAAIKDGTPGYFLGGLNQVSGPSSCSFSGSAYTVEFAHKDDPRSPVDFHYIDKIQEGDVLVIKAPDDLETAVFGGLMALRAKHLKAAGVVVHGRVRDLEEQRSVGIPLFAHGTCPSSSNQTAKVVSVGKTIQIGSATIEKSDYIKMDENGAVIIPLSRLSQTMSFLQDYIPRRIAADQQIAEDIRAGLEAGPSMKLRRKGL